MFPSQVIQVHPSDPHFSGLTSQASFILVAFPGLFAEVITGMKSQSGIGRIAAAEDYIQKAARTWGMWVGIGDYETQTFDLVTYRQEDAIVYTDVTTPSITGQPSYFEHVVYVDKHPQPTHDGVNGSLPTGILDFWGRISQET
eukprot:gene39666-49015_t